MHNKFFLRNPHCSDITSEQNMGTSPQSAMGLVSLVGCFSAIRNPKSAMNYSVVCFSEIRNPQSAMRRVWL